MHSMAIYRSVPYLMTNYAPTGRTDLGLYHYTNFLFTFLHANKLLNKLLLLEYNIYTIYMASV